MSLRSIVPLSFLLLMATATAAAGMLGYCGGSGVLWWMNQEVYARLRGIFYLTDLLPLGPFEFASILFLSAAALVAFGRNERVAFLANHIALLAVLYAGMVDWQANVAMLLPFAPDFSLVMSRVDWPLALAVIVALASTISCHWRYLSAPFRRRAAA
jgi:hypothetical protein